MIIKLPYGLNDGKLVHISEVESGLSCNCICPSCGSTLIARKGEKNIHHFAHYSSPECRYGLQTALHLAAKEILSQEKVFMMPPKNIPIDFEFKKEVFQDNPMLILGGQPYYTLFAAKAINISNVRLEKRINDFVPDIILEFENRTLLIEIAVTHFVDSIKKEKIKKSGISTIEIDLSNYTSEFTIDSLRSILLTNVDLKHWVYNVRETELWEVAKSKLQNENLIALEKEKDEVKKRQELFARLIQQRKLETQIREEKAKKREEVYKKYYRKIVERSTTSKFNGDIFPVLHVEPCPLKKRTFQGMPYANAIEDCRKCRYFGDFRLDEVDPEVVYVVCLAEHYLNKLGHL